MDIEKIKFECKNLENIEKIRNNPLAVAIREILKIIPFVTSYTDEMIEIKLNEFQENKRMELVNHILEDRELICRDDVNEIEFIMNVAKTIEAIDKLSTNDKIKFFANLIKSSYSKDYKIDNDYYDEYLYILKGLSYREIVVLSVIYKYEISLKDREDFEWGCACESVAKLLNIEVDEITSTLMKLSSNGLIYFKLGGGYLLLQAAPKEKKGTTEYCKKFIKTILD